MRWAHINSEQLVDYFYSRWLPEQQAAIEFHLATCDPCAQTASKVFNALCLAEGWTAREQSKAQEQPATRAAQAFATARTA